MKLIWKQEQLFSVSTMKTYFVVKVVTSTACQVVMLNSVHDVCAKINGTFTMLQSANIEVIQIKHIIVYYYQNPVGVGCDTVNLAGLFSMPVGFHKLVTSFMRTFFTNSSALIKF